MIFLNFKWDVKSIIGLVCASSLLAGCGGSSHQSDTNTNGSSEAVAHYAVTLSTDSGVTAESFFNDYDKTILSGNVVSGSSTKFILTPKVGYKVDVVSGCNATLSGNTLTTGAIIQDCAITVTTKKTLIGLAGITDPILALCIEETEITSFEALTELQCDGKGVLSLEGLSSFINLQKLSVQGEVRVEQASPYYQPSYEAWINTGRLHGYLDFTQLTKLTYLNLNYNYGIEAVDLSKNTGLTYLNLGHNLLNNLDISSLTQLTTLYVHDNKLHNIDLSHNTKLTFLDLGDANYSYIRDFTRGGLPRYYPGDKGNPISNIDVSMLTELTDLYLSYLDLSTVDLSRNTKLTNLHLNANGDYWNSNPSLIELDLSHNTQLVTLDVSVGKLTNLDLRGLVNLTTLSVFGNKLTNIDFPVEGLKLTELNVSDNNLSTLDTSSFLLLTKLDVSHNQLTNLNVASNTKLIVLRGNQNNLSTQDLSNLPDLQEVYLNNNQLQNVFFAGDVNLAKIVLDNNQLTSLDLSNLTMLSDISTTKNLLATINFSANPYITTLNLDNNSLASLDVGALSALKRVYLSENRTLSSLTVSANNSALAEIRMNDCNLTSLNTTVLPALTDLRIMQCPLTSIDFTKNIELAYLDLRGDLLTAVDFTNNTKLTYANLQNNKLANVSGVEFIAYKDASLNFKLNSFNVTALTYLEKLRLVNGYSNLSY